MILLDTNVLSALMREVADETVSAWLDLQPSESVWTTSVSIFEIRTGLELLHPSRRRRALEAAFDCLITEDLQGRVQVFDQSAALAAGQLAAESQRRGRPVEFRDAEIAGIAASRRATLATRNTRHFQEMGVDLVDPWSA